MRLLRSPVPGIWPVFLVLGVLAATAWLRPLEARRFQQGPACFISGRVTAGTARLPGVVLTAAGESGPAATSSTNLDGSYTIDVQAPGRYQLKADLAAFAPATQEVVVGSDCRARADFVLTLASRTAGATPVTAEPLPAQRSLAGTQFQRMAPIADQAGVRLVQDSAAAVSEEGQAVLAQLSLPPGFSPDTLSESVTAFGSAGRTNDMLLFGGGREGMFGPEGPPGTDAGDGSTGIRGQRPRRARTWPRRRPGPRRPRRGHGPRWRNGPGWRPWRTRRAGRRTRWGTVAGRQARHGSAEQPAPRPALLQPRRVGARRESLFAHRAPDDETRLPAAAVPGVGRRPAEDPQAVRRRAAHDVLPQLLGQPLVEPVRPLLDGAHGRGARRRLLGNLRPAHRPRHGTAVRRQPDPADRLSPSAVALLQFYPLPNQPGDRQNYHYTTTTHTSSDDINFRFVRTFGAEGRGRGGGAAAWVAAGARGGPMGGGTNLNVALRYSRTKNDQASAFPTLAGKISRTGWDVPVGLSFSKWGMNHNLRLTFNRNESATANAVRLRARRRRRRGHHRRVDATRSTGACRTSRSRASAALRRRRTRRCGRTRPSRSATR